MMLIEVDNFDREGPGFDDKLILYINDEQTARDIAAFLNEDCDDRYCDRFFRAVPNSYRLRKFTP